MTMAAISDRLTRHEMTRDTPDVCPIPERVDGYWLGPAGVWRDRAIAAEAALARLLQTMRTT